MNKIIDSGELKNINKPARYVGGEVNQVVKNKYSISVTLCYPNIYEKGMSNYIVRLLYKNINKLDGIFCKRCFAPEADFEELLYSIKQELYDLEEKKSIRESNIIIFIIDSELDYTNFLNMLKLSNIKFNKEDRKNKGPKIILLTSNLLNIKPVEQFFDAIFNREKQVQNIHELMEYISKYKGNVDIAKGNGKYLLSDIIPSIKIDNSSIIIDLSTVDNLENTVNSVKKSIKEQGITKVSFVNQNKIDGDKFCELIYRLKVNINDIRILVKNLDFAKFNTDNLNIVLPCMERAAINFNVTTCNKKIMDIIGGGIEKEKLIEKVKCSFKNNWNSIKLNFSIGLPNETYEDIDDILNIAEEIVNIYAQSKAKEKLSLIVNLNCYIPNIYEFNNYNVNNINKLETKIRYIKDKKYDSIIKVNVETIDTYITKVLLKNGEREIANIITYAYKLGARFDGDNKLYNKQAWEKAIYEYSHVIKKYTKFNI